MNMILFSNYRLTNPGRDHVHDVGNIFLAENSPRNTRTKPAGVSMVFIASNVLQIAQSAILSILVLMIYFVPLWALSSEGSHHKNMDKISLTNSLLVEGYLKVLGSERIGFENNTRLFRTTLTSAHNPPQVTDLIESLVTNDRLPDLFRHYCAPKTMFESCMIMTIANDSSRGEYSL
jgi:hypothetical protein